MPGWALFRRKEKPSADEAACPSARTQSWRAAARVARARGTGHDPWDMGSALWGMMHGHGAWGMPHGLPHGAWGMPRMAHGAARAMPPGHAPPPRRGKGHAACGMDRAAMDARERRVRWPHKNTLLNNTEFARWRNMLFFVQFKAFAI